MTLSFYEQKLLDKARIHKQLYPNLPWWAVSKVYMNAAVKLQKKGLVSIVPSTKFKGGLMYEVTLTKEAL